MSLNFKKGVPIALIDGSRYDGEVLYVDPDKEGEKVFKLKDGKFKIIPEEKVRASYYICGKAGSGKSYMANDIATMYHLMFPKNHIYLFSQLEEDPAFEKLERKGVIKRVVIDKSLAEDPINVTEDMRDCLAIFDDIDCLNDKEVKKAVNLLRVQILELGRKNNISVINCCHNVNHTGADGQFNRSIMNELKNFIFFNKSLNHHQIEYCLKTYFGFKNKQIQNLINNKSTRWTCISANHPQYVLTETVAALTN